MKGESKWRGNREYSPENCVMVPHEINSSMILRTSLRGDLPIGVRLHRKSYVAQITMYAKPHT